MTMLLFRPLRNQGDVIHSGDLVISKIAKSRNCPQGPNVFRRTYQKTQNSLQNRKKQISGNYGANLPTYPRLCFIVRNASCLLVRFGTVGTCLKSTFGLLGQFGGFRTVSSKPSEIIDLSKMMMLPRKPKRAHRK